MKIKDLITARNNWLQAQNDYYDLLAEKSGEEARFGDSWPDAEKDVQEARERIRYWREETDRIASMPLEA